MFRAKAPKVQTIKTAESAFQLILKYPAAIYNATVNTLTDLWSLYNVTECEYLYNTRGFHYVMQSGRYTDKEKIHSEIDRNTPWSYLHLFDQAIVCLTIQKVHSVVILLLP